MTSTFLDLVPDGWLRSYLLAMEECKNEMPLPFHFLAGAVVIGQMIGLNAWATVSKGVRVYPNINGLLLSPAGKCRRGEGTKITIKLAKMAQCNVLSGKATPEGLADEIGEHGDVLLYVEELSMLLTKQDFQRPIIPVLTKLLLHGDGPADMRTRTMGKKITIEYVNLSALFTSAPDWFMTTIPEEAFGGGLMSRFIVCCLDERDRYHIDIQADDESGMNILTDLGKELGELRGVLYGHIKGTNDAAKWINDWYYKNETEILSDERLGPHRNRKPSNLLRLALILCASAGDSSLTAARLSAALDILNYMEPTLIKLYGLTDEIVSRMSTGEKKIMWQLGTLSEQETMHRDLARICAPFFDRGMRDMRICLEGMVEKGMITPVFMSTHAHTWPPRAWRLTNVKID